MILINTNYKRGIFKRMDEFIHIKKNIFLSLRKFSRITKFKIPLYLKTIL